MNEAETLLSYFPARPSPKWVAIVAIGVVLPQWLGFPDVSNLLRAGLSLAGLVFIASAFTRWEEDRRDKRSHQIDEGDR